MVFVGGSIGCVVTLQITRWLDRLLEELGVSDKLREEVARSMLVVNLGPTTTLSAGPRTNLISAVNSVDEFVFAGNDVAPIIDEARRSGRRLVNDLSDRPLEESNSLSLALDVAGSISDGEDGLTFDPLATHFGHSLKHYANGLRKVGLKNVIGRAMASPGAYRVGELAAEAEAAGELELA